MSKSISTCGTGSPVCRFANQLPCLPTSPNKIVQPCVPCWGFGLRAIWLPWNSRTVALNLFSTTCNSSRRNVKFAVLDKAKPPPRIEMVYWMGGIDPQTTMFKNMHWVARHRSSITRKTGTTRCSKAPCVAVMRNWMLQEGPAELNKGGLSSKGRGDATSHQLSVWVPHQIVITPPSLNSNEEEKPFIYLNHSPLSLWKKKKDIYKVDTKSKEDKTLSATSLVRRGRVPGYKPPKGLFQFLHR